MKAFGIIIRCCIALMLWGLVFWVYTNPLDTGFHWFVDLGLSGVTSCIVLVHDGFRNWFLNDNQL